MNRDLPTRVVVGKNGAYWRDFTDDPDVPGYSMCPVSTDNDPVEPVAVYVRVENPPDATDDEPTTANGRDMLAHAVQYNPADADRKVIAAKIRAIEVDAALAAHPSRGLARQAISQLERFGRHDIGCGQEPCSCGLTGRRDHLYVLADRLGMSGYRQAALRWLEAQERPLTVEEFEQREGVRIVAAHRESVGIEGSGMYEAAIDRADLIAHLNPEGRPAYENKIEPLREALIAALPGAFALADGLGWESEDWTDRDTLEAVADYLLARLSEPPQEPERPV